MSKAAIQAVQSIVRKLQTERQAHENAVAEIDRTFAALGIAGAAPKKRGRRPGRPKKTAKPKTVKGKRRKFKTTATELVIATIKMAGAKGATGAQLTKAWKAAKRPGNAYNTLGLLTKAEKIQRNSIKGERGSRYTIA